MGFWKDLFGYKDYNEEFKKRLAKEKKNLEKEKVENEKILEKKLEENKKLKEKEGLENERKKFIQEKKLEQEKLQNEKISDSKEITEIKESKNIENDKKEIIFIEEESKADIKNISESNNEIIIDEKVIRDKFILEENFFNKQIEKINSRIKERKVSFKKFIEEDPDGDASSFFTAFNVYFVNLCNSKYGRGDEISKIIVDSKSAMESALDLWNEDEDYSEGGNIMYNYLMQSICLGILLNLDKSYFEDLAELIESNNYNDFAILYLLNSQVPTTKMSQNLMYEDDITLFLKEIISTEDKIEAQNKIKEYLENIYYTKDNLANYYNIHNTNNANYYGYWAWDIATIVKLKNLDFNEFKNIPYFPHDIFTK